MIKIFRQLIGLIVVSPFILLVYLTSIFMGKEKAIRKFGPSATFVSKQAIRLFVPNIKNADDFDSFPSGMKSNFWLWKPFIDKWDFERSHQIGTGDSFCDHTYKRKKRKQ